LNPKRLAYVHVVRGEVAVNGAALKGGDAAKLEMESALAISGGKNAEVIVFDLAA
jgi:redox-sensitive bicupin YhaK (pirin superfamily)